MGDLIRYPMNVAQLRQYLQIFTGQSDVTVLPGVGGSTHVPTRIVRIDTTSPLAPIIASHEGDHIVYTSATAYDTLHSNGERLLCNALEDGRMERLDYTTKHPGLRAQHQALVDYVLPEMLKEPYLIQAIKAMYMLVGGYTFAEAKLKKQARDILAKFRPWITPCRKAATTDDLAKLVPEIIKLFNLPDQNAIREEKAAAKAEEEAQKESEEWWEKRPEPAKADESDDEEDDEGWESEPDTNTQPSPDGFPQPGQDGEGDSDRGDDDEGDEQGEDYEGDELGDGNGGFTGQSDDVPEDVREAGGGERGAVTYDADEVRNALDAAEKLGQKGEGGKAGKADKVRGHDKVTGGPTVNQLLKQGNRLANAMRRLDDRAKTALEGDTVLAPTPTMTPIAAGSKEQMDPNKLPASMAPIADLEKAWKGEMGWGTLFTIDPKLFRLDDGHGGLGYAGSVYYVRDRRCSDQHTRGAANVAVETELHYRATENYLSRVLRTLMQSADRKGIRDYERTGLLDPRRAYHVNEGQFTIFRQPPRPRDARPVVILTVDQSGSMNPGFQPDPERRAKQRSFHAMSAALVLSGALARLNIPHEIHSFSSQGGVIKRFEDPAGLPAIRSMGNLWAGGGGGTSAAEALGFAWARIAMRPEPRKIIFQVTDGEVSNNTKLLADAIEKMGGIVIGVGIGHGLHMRDTYTRTFEVDNAADLPNAFARLLKKFIPGRRAA